MAEVRSGVGLLPGDVTLAWHPGGKHLAVADAGSLYLLSTETGEKQRLTTPPQARSHRNPAFSPDGRSLAFSRGSSFVGDLYLLSLDAGLAPQGEPARLTTGLEVASFPVWTVDGGEIIFSAGLFLAPNSWRMAVSGPGKPQRLASVGEGGSQPALARAGRRLTYSRMACDSNIWRIEVPARETATPRRTRLITSSRAEMLPQFSPDGKRIAFQSDRSGTSEIWVCDSDGSNAIPVTSFGGPLTGSPRWSPDGKQIAFDSLLEGHFDIFVASAGGGKPRRLTTNPAQDLIPSWSRDGRWIYFQSNRSGSSQVWKMPAPGLSAPKEPIQVTQNGGDAPIESHDGRLVYYVKSGELWQVPAAGGEETQALGSVYNARSFSVADKGIYFIPRDEAAVRLFDFNTRAIRTVATLGQSRLGDLAVSPDGRTILYTQIDSRGSDLMLVENFP